MNKINRKLVEFLSEHGMKASVIDYGHAVQLVEEIEDRHENGGLTDEIFNRYLTRFRDKYSENSKYKSVIVLAAPQKPGILKFTSKGKEYPVMIPPTYVYGDLGTLAEGLVKSLIGPLGYSVDNAALPCKLLAARSGLGSYGKNNICYVQGLGSFHRIMAFYSDMPCEEDSWQEAQVLDSCRSCKICMKNCPTGCITDERFLIHAEKCLTHLNENGGSFPEWLNRSAHNAIVGCMDCQKLCPHNKSMMDDIQTLDSFDSKETEMILNGAPFKELPEALAAKLDRLCLSEYYDVLPRNLSVLINMDI